jgi:hypothetical protein
MEPRDLARRLAQNEITEFEIGWREYQRLVWWLVSQETKLQAEPDYQSNVENGEDAGAIDIVVRLTGPPISLFGDEALQTGLQIFVECKQYRATLTLDKVGKVFCHSILEQPDALWIVSPRRLSAQAFAYAKRIFRTSESDASPPLLQRTRFRHWQLRELIDRRGLSRSDQLDFTDWQILQLTAFGTVVVASANSLASSGRPVFSGPNAVFRIQLVADGPLRPDSRLQVALECDPPSDRPMILDSRPADPGEILADIPCVELHGRDITAILVKDLDRDVEQRVDIGCLSFQVFHSTLFELRPNRADAIAHELSLPSSKRITCLFGPAGVGKSTLLEQIAWKLVKNFGWDVRAHTISEGTDYSLLYDLVEWFALAVAPLDFININNGELDARRSIVSTLAYQYSGLQTPETTQSLIDAAARGVLNEALIQQLVRLLGRIASARETPLLVVLRDMHAASPAVQKVLSQLFLRLRDQGWGNVRFIIEARTGPETGTFDANPLSELSERLGNDFAGIDILPLSIEELHSAFHLHIRSSHLTEVVRHVHRTTGGYPLLVNHLLRDLRTRAIITESRVDPDVYSIDLNALQGLQPVLFPTQFDSILQRRLAAAASSDSEIMTACLGIAAHTLRVMPGGVPRALVVGLVASGLGVTSEQVDGCIYLATSLGILYPEDTGRAISFAHEALRTAAIEFSRGKTGFIRVISAVVNMPGKTTALGPFRSDLLRALLANEVGRLEDAMSLTLSAESIAVETGNLVQRRLALECALGVLSRNARPDDNWARNELAVRERLVWTVMQQSSQLFVGETIKRCEERLAVMHAAGLVSASDRDTAQFHYSRCRVVIATRALDAVALLDALPVMCASALDISQLHYALTRIILVAIEIDDVLSARRAIEYCLRLPVLEHEPDVRLSFLSEIGDMLIVERQSAELVVRQAAVDLADRLIQAGRTDARSKAHAQINLFVAQARAGLLRVNVADLRSLDENWSEQGFLNPLLRLKNLRGYVAASGDPEVTDQAYTLWQACLELADATGHSSIAWQAAQNLSALERTRENALASSAFLTRTTAILAPFQGHRNQLRKLISQLLDAVSQSGQLSDNAASASLPIPLETLGNLKRVSSISRYIRQKNTSRPSYLF